MAKVVGFPVEENFNEEQNDEYDKEYERFLELLTKFGSDPEFLEFMKLYKIYIGD